MGLFKRKPHPVKLLQEVERPATYVAEGRERWLKSYVIDGLRRLPLALSAAERDGARWKQMMADGHCSVEQFERADLLLDYVNGQAYHAHIGSGHVLPVPQGVSYDGHARFVAHGV